MSGNQRIFTVDCLGNSCPVVPLFEYPSNTPVQWAQIVRIYSGN